MSTEEEFGESGDALDDCVYEDEAFDEYFDSFESGEGDEEDESPAALDHKDEKDSDDGFKEARHVHENGWLFESGDCVQVFWTNEREWFSGKVAQIDAAKGRFFVQYDDGEEAWETAERMRYAPEAFELASDAFHQLQLLILPDATQEDKTAMLVRLLKVTVLVYWRDSSSWFPGSIAQVDSEACALQIEYDDGDLRWKPECDFFNILVRVSTGTATCPGTSASHLTAAQPHADLAVAETEAEVERVLIPRAYKAVITDHFQPERTPRPYISVASTIGSVLSPRRSRYSERRYLHSNTKLECTTSDGQRLTATATATGDTVLRYCIVQTDIAVEEWKSNGDLLNQVHQFSQCG